MLENNLDNEKEKKEEFTNISKNKPLQYPRHLHKSIIKKNQLNLKKKPRLQSFFLKAFPLF